MSNQNHPEEEIQTYLQELRKSGAFSSNSNMDKTYINYIKTQKIDSDYIKSWKEDSQDKALLPPERDHL